jgi:predicted aspartyl protease
MKKVKFIVCSILVISLTSCSIFKNKKLLKIGSFGQASFMSELPFLFIDNQIIIEVEIDNKAYNFIFDSGAEGSIISSGLTSELELKQESSIRAEGVHKSKRIGLYVLEEIKLSSVPFLELLCIEQDLFAITCDFPIHGLIGNNLMKKANWKIDYQNKIITFWDNKREVLQPPNSEIIEFKHEGHSNATINLTVDNIQKEFTFDTGSSSSIKANYSLFKDLGLDGSTGECAIGMSTSIGLYGPKTNKNFRRKISTLSIGGKDIENRIISFAENGSYLIGNKFWKNYVLTIDWKKSVIYLEKNKEETPDILRTFQYYFFPDFENETFSIKSYWTSHSSYQPIHPNNEVVAIENYQAGGGIDFCDFYINSLPLLLKKDTLEIEVNENGKKKKIKLQKEVLIK